MTSDNGEWISMRCAKPLRPLRPGLNGSSQTVRLPFRQSSITRASWPKELSLFSSTPGQRWSKGNLIRVLGMIPHVRESEYTRIWRTESSRLDLGIVPTRRSGIYRAEPRPQEAVGSESIGSGSVDRAHIGMLSTKRKDDGFLRSRLSKSP